MLFTDLHNFIIQIVTMASTLTSLRSLLQHIRCLTMPKNERGTMHSVKARLTLIPHGVASQDSRISRVNKNSGIVGLNNNKGLILKKRRKISKNFSRSRVSSSESKQKRSIRRWDSRNQGVQKVPLDLRDLLVEKDLESHKISLS